jgi:AcrR family transcriptional regulator
MMVAATDIQCRLGGKTGGNPLGGCQMVKKADIPGHVVSSALTLAATYGWRQLTLGQIAEEAGIGLTDLYRLYPSKSSILNGFVNQIDEAVLASKFDHGDDDSARDRLFDVLMRRFELLGEEKPGLNAVARDSLGDPCALLCHGPRLLRSMAWMLEAAGIGSAGLNGRIRIKGLAVIYASVLPVWLRDDSDDLAKTMAALDRRLARAENIASMVWGRRRVGGEPPETAPNGGNEPRPAPAG